jgi:iron complex outermembrane receptor protein
VLLNYTQVKSKIAYQVSPTSGHHHHRRPAEPVAEVVERHAVLRRRHLQRARLGRQRSSFLTRVPGQNNNDVEGKNSTLNVDLSISYKVNDQLDLTLEGVNLTNEANDQFISRARNSSVVYHVTGREYLIGVRYKF